MDLNLMTNFCAVLGATNPGDPLCDRSVSRMLFDQEVQAWQPVWCHQLPDHQLPCFIVSRSGTTMQQWEMWATMGRERWLLWLLHQHTTVLDV